MHKNNHMTDGKNIWNYTKENNGSFQIDEPQKISRLFFPLMNRHGMKCSVNPELKGDICSSFHNYHSIPVVTEDFHRILNNRNFWVCVEGEKPFSATGVDAWNKASTKDISTSAKGEIGLFHLYKNNQQLQLETNISVFVPPVDDFVEIMIVKIKNSSSKAKKITPWAAVPVYGRTPDNLRDHRNVTSMFIENYREEHGVRIKPRINFNEHGHSNNATNYLVLGYSEEGNAPADIFRTVRDFAGEGGSLDMPGAVENDWTEESFEGRQIDGFEAIGALKFEKTSLAPGEEKSYVILNTITDNPFEKVSHWKETYGSLEKAHSFEEETRKYWQQIINEVSFESGNKVFDNWAKWVNYQIICRQVYGNSYLPDFGYGRGGRGWRDLFSDLLSLFLIDPMSAKEEIINNFKGIRVDGTNATIVGTKPGEFVADRNNVPRTWSDHGTWPFFVLNFYIQQTGDLNIILKEVDFWKDLHIFRSKKKDELWDESQGFKQKTSSGEVYESSILEHILLQHYCSFFNVGKHNNILLEGADWNDTYDMARNRGESVCFYNWYGGNFRVLAGLLKKIADTGVEKVSLLEDMLMLIDTVSGEKTDYHSPEKRRAHLMKYYEKVSHTVSGRKVDVDIHKLIQDLEDKSTIITDHIRKNELIKTSEGDIFYNGHYDDEEKRVHGEHPKGLRIDLTSQVLPTIFGTATDDQIPDIFKTVKKYLRDDHTGGLHLCSDFHEDKMYFGRLTGFVYGHKEHGGKWMQQNVMYLYGLYSRGFVKEGYEVYKEVFDLCHNSVVSKIFPGIPSYFEMDGRGSYHYLTGSATWLILALVTRIYGVRGEYGDLLIEPRLVKEQFEGASEIKFHGNFREKEINVIFSNEKRLDWGQYKIGAATVNEKTTNHFILNDGTAVRISQKELDNISENKLTIKLEFTAY